MAPVRIRRRHHANHRRPGADMGIPGCPALKFDDSVPLAVRIPNDMYGEVQRSAQHEGMTVAAYARSALFARLQAARIARRAEKIAASGSKGRSNDLAASGRRDPT